VGALKIPARPGGILTKREPSLPFHAERTDEQGQLGAAEAVMHSRRLFFGLQFQLALILLQKEAQAFGGVEQALPLFIVEGDREAPEPVDADASLFAHL
jgi:hypothetical protein